MESRKAPQDKLICISRSCKFLLGKKLDDLATLFRSNLLQSHHACQQVWHDYHVTVFCFFSTFSSDALHLSQGKPASADEFVPSLIYLLIHTSPEHLHSNIKWVWLHILVCMTSSISHALLLQACHMAGNPDLTSQYLHQLSGWSCQIFCYLPS